MRLTIRSSNSDHLRIAEDLVDEKFPGQVASIEYFSPSRSPDSSADDSLSSASFSEANDFRQAALFCLDFAERCGSSLNFTFDGIEMPLEPNEPISRLENRLLIRSGYRAFPDDSASINQDKLPLRDALYLAVSLRELTGIDVYVDNPNGVSFIPKSAEEAEAMYFTTV